MKVVLVNPIWTLRNLLPTNLAELAGYIRAHGYNETAIADLNYEIRDGFDANRIIERSVDIVSAKKPDIIGITCNTMHVPFCAEFCRAYKQRFKTPVILGGIHPTFRTNRMFQLTGTDYIVRGEGEETLLELLDALRGEKEIGGIRGCSFRRGDKIIHNPDRPLIEDLSALPFPAYDLLLPYIQKLRKGGLGIRRDMDRISVNASRGCPFRCIFCASNKMWRYQRRKPVALVIEEILYLTQACRKKDVHIEDDSLNLDKKWFNGLLRMVEGLNITWSCSMRIDMIDSGLLRKMRKAGCRQIYHGIESGSPRLRRMLGKRFSRALTNDSIIAAVRKEIKNGILSTCSFMAGIPTETGADFNDTGDLLMELRKIGADTQLWIMTPYPQIKAADIYKDKLIRIDRWRILRQSDIYKPEQLFLYDKFHHKYASENPALCMFKPNVRLSDFLRAYQELQRLIVSSGYSDPRASNYVVERKGGGYFVAGSEKVRLGDSADKKEVSTGYLSFEPPFRKNKIIRYLNKTNHRRLLLSIKSDNIKRLTESRDVIFQALRAVINKNIQLILMRPIPLRIFNRRQRDLMSEISMPGSCRDCYELFKVNKRGKVELCTGGELFNEGTADNRDDIVYCFYRTVLLNDKATGCVFSQRREVLSFVKKDEAARSCMWEAKRSFLKRSYDEALKFILKAKSYGYDDWEMYYYSGLCYKKKNNFNAMWKELQKGIRLNLTKASALH